MNRVKRGDEMGRPKKTKIVEEKKEEIGKPRVKC